LPAADPVHVHKRDRTSDGVRAGLQRRVAARLDVDAELLPVSRDLRSCHDLGPGLITGVATTINRYRNLYGDRSHLRLALWMSLVTFPMNLR